MKLMQLSQSYMYKCNALKIGYVTGKAGEIVKVL